MRFYRKQSHSVHDLKVHLVWITKYRHKVLTQQIGIRIREIIRQICDSKVPYEGDVATLFGQWIPRNPSFIKNFFSLSSQKIFRHSIPRAITCWKTPGVAWHKSTSAFRFTFQFSADPVQHSTNRCFCWFKYFISSVFVMWKSWNIRPMICIVPTTD